MADSNTNIWTIIQKLLPIASAPWVLALITLVENNASQVEAVIGQFIANHPDVPAWLKEVATTDLTDAIRFLPVIQGLLSLI